MSTPIVPNLSNIPTPPAFAKLVDKDGNITSSWRDYFSNLTLYLKQFLSNEGLVMPQQTSANIALLNTAQSIGALLYNSTTNHIEGNVNGTFQVII